jgi:hypothetical protein
MAGLIGSLLLSTLTPLTVLLFPLLGIDGALASGILTTVINLIGI